MRGISCVPGELADDPDFHLHLGDAQGVQHESDLGSAIALRQVLADAPPAPPVPVVDLRAFDPAQLLPRDPTDKNARPDVYGGNYSTLAKVLACTRAASVSTRRSLRCAAIRGPLQVLSAFLHI